MTFDAYRKNTQSFRIDTPAKLAGGLKVTATHPFLSVENEWIEAADLAVGDQVRSAEGIIRIDSIQKLKYGHRTYNFSVRDSHNYFVSATGKNYYLVHN